MFIKINYFTESTAPSETFVLYQPGATFDKHYNSHFKPFNFIPPADVKKVRQNVILPAPFICTITCIIHTSIPVVM